MEDKTKNEVTSGKLSDASTCSVVCYHCDGKGKYLIKVKQRNGFFNELVLCHTCMGGGKITKQEDSDASYMSKTRRYREDRTHMDY